MSVVAKRLDGSRCHLVRSYRPWPRRQCVRWVSSFPSQTGTALPLFGPCLLWPIGRLSQLLLSTCYCYMLVIRAGLRQIKTSVGWPGWMKKWVGLGFKNDACLTLVNSFAGGMFRRKQGPLDYANLPPPCVKCNQGCGGRGAWGSYVPVNTSEGSGGPLNVHHSNIILTLRPKTHKHICKPFWACQNALNKFTYSNLEFHIFFRGRARTPGFRGGGRGGKNGESTIVRNKLYVLRFNLYRVSTQCS